MNDPRLTDWLEATRLAIEAPEEQRQASLDALAASREQIARSLNEAPLCAPICDALSQQLKEAEQALNQLLLALSCSVDAQLGELRRVREAAECYRPARANRPAFVSRSI